MFESLTSSLSAAFQKLNSKRVISDKDFDCTMQEVSKALIDADVNLKVVNDLIASVRDKVIGEKVIKGVLPGQMVIKKMEEYLVNALGNNKSELDITSSRPAVIMMVGLQGVGKTTSTTKVALKLCNKQKKVLMASLDIYRPAAQEQLQILGNQASIDSVSIIKGEYPIDIAQRAFKDAQHGCYDVLILDTAGRLHIDKDMMQELQAIKNKVSPSEVILVVDSMMGQDAVNVASAFHKDLGITGIILTRTDGDTRGGAVLSMKMVVGCPIKFITTGEKLNDIDDFYPDRIAKRILNMGDITSLVEKATEVVGKEAVDELQKKAQKGNFDLNDFVAQLKALNKMGGIASILKFLPGFDNNIKRQVSSMVDDSKINQYIAIINSMTKQERCNPKILNGARKLRISRGAGVTVNSINILLKQFYQINGVISKFSKMNSEQFKNIDIMNLLKN
ncbi:signal recognition particle protein [Neoehrlichia mikurensis]|uniref:signal-recognition-particle GTPase n=1 Tax=Neoehrlichia mikurensis TaxID=89586 RepID=A0A9Q9BT91_9RICK|nr:signal recognition particle protein [Neoehrlichia mikurensis]QXK91845.1 signal recognition particle protein [Neoehrlichia mikurensis]QXK93058.1 signal recognition particle protein [Neoehrlichia mikurensis]QXK93537.1 signal recognition particle protein [Neoehrlichia mikurensis]UTO55507.1 signal recognition particle protein [Neoehrlichia mikurensis]UTO56429.1 signal recognition particle protein [Neoehrlichia mikurensis]